MSRIIVLFVFMLLSSVLNALQIKAASANMACSSLNDIPLNDGAKGLLIKRCASLVYANQSSSIKYSSLDKGEYISTNVTSDRLGCGFPTRFVRIEIGSGHHTDSDGNDFTGTYVYVSLQDYDCVGNLLIDTTGENDLLPPEAIDINPFSSAVITVDTDMDFMDGVTRHITANLFLTGQGFVNADKIKNVFKRERFDESTNLAQKFRDASFTGDLTFDSDSYVVIDGIILVFKLKFTHEDF